MDPSEISLGPNFYANQIGVPMRTLIEEATWQTIGGPIGCDNSNRTVPCAGSIGYVRGSTQVGVWDEDGRFLPLNVPRVLSRVETGHAAIREDPLPCQQIIDMRAGSLGYIKGSNRIGVWQPDGSFLPLDLEDITSRLDALERGSSGLNAARARDLTNRAIVYGQLSECLRIIEKAANRGEHTLDRYSKGGHELTGGPGYFRVGFTLEPATIAALKLRGFDVQQGSDGSVLEISW
jgi:hypothetical protein